MGDKQVGPEFVAGVLADVYETNYDAKQDGVTERGRTIMIDIFSQVEPTERDKVYQEFLKELGERGFEIKEFQETVH